MAGRHFTREAADAWRVLQGGVFCIYKPPRLTLIETLTHIPVHLVNGLNKMRYSRPQHIVNIKGSVGGELTISKEFDYSQHPLVLGPLYEEKDIDLTALSYLKSLASGVCVLGINKQGAETVNALQQCQLMSSFVIEGKLGVATDNFFYTGKAIERSSWEHVTRGRLEKILTKIQSQNQKLMMDQLGIPTNSQAAYEALSADGLVRPSSSQAPIIYGIKLLNKKGYNFTLEVSGANLLSEFLAEFVNDIGLMGRTNAHVVQMRCIRQGPFTLEHALLRKHWQLQPILTNIAECRPLVTATTHQHASLAPLQQFQEEQRAVDNQRQTERQLHSRREQLIAEQLIQEFSEDDDYTHYLKTCNNDYQV